MRAAPPLSGKFKKLLYKERDIMNTYTFEVTTFKPSGKYSETYEAIISTKYNLDDPDKAVQGMAVYNVREDLEAYCAENYQGYHCVCLDERLDWPFMYAAK